MALPPRAPRPQTVRCRSGRALRGMPAVPEVPVGASVDVPMRMDALANEHAP
ncbi:MAG: hypothetical protein QM761_14635 [Pseudoxanthomonas sp.]